MAHTVSRSISDEALSRIIQIESAGNPRATARTSSALGLAQFLNGTWLNVVRQHRPDLFNGRTNAQVLALRADPSLSIELLARFTEDNARVLGAGFTDGDLYLAHFSGAGVARKLMQAKPMADASTCYSAAAIAANRSILEDKSVGDVRAWAARKMASAGGHDYVAQFYQPPDPVEPEHQAPADADDDVPVKIDREAPPKSLAESRIFKGAATAAGASAPPLAGAVIKASTGDVPDAAPSITDHVTDVVDRAGHVIETSRTVTDNLPAAPKGFWHLLAGILTDPIVVCVFGALAFGALGYVVWERRRKLREEGV